MSSSLWRAENSWERQHHSLERGRGCCEEKGDFEYLSSSCTCVSRVGMSLLFGCLMITVGFEVNLGTHKEKNAI